MRKITLSDVSKKCGYSASTISKVYSKSNPSFGVSTQAQRDILLCASELGYRPEVTRELLTGIMDDKLNLLVLSPWLYAQHSDFMHVFNRTLAEDHIADKVKITIQSYYQNHLKNTLNVTKACRYDVILLVGSAEADHQYLAKHKSAYPNLILVNRTLEGYPSVCGNDFETAKQLVFLTDLPKYERKVILRHEIMSDREKKRVLGYRSALQSFEEDTIGVEINEHFFKNLLRTYGQSKTVFFVPHFYPAARLLIQAVKEKLDIPTQIGIVCYDTNSQIADFLPMLLTCADANVRDMTIAAIGAACAMRAGIPLTNQIIPAHILPGNTVFMDKEITGKDFEHEQEN